MAIRTRIPLITLVVGVFVFNMSEFMPIGILSSISADLGVSESATGLIVSVYAWVVAAITLPVMMYFRNYEYKKLMLFCVAVFAIFQLTSALSTNYWMLMASRLGVAFAHSIFWSIVTPMAVRSVGPEDRRLAISSVEAGTAVAMILGLPVGRTVGLLLGWRASFLTMCIVSLIVLLIMIKELPIMENPGNFTLNKIPKLFSNRVLISIYILTAVFVTAHYTAYGFIEPFLLQVSEMSENLITIVLSMFGVAGIIGGVVFTKYYEVSEKGFMFLSVLCPAVCMLLLSLQCDNWIVIICIAVLWGLCITLFNASFQNEVMNVALSEGVVIAVGMFSGIFNLGIGTGSLIGGIVTDGPGVYNIGIVGAAIGLLSLAILLLLVFPAMKRRISQRS